ncbi:hypothetical protein GCM10023317_93260 [Actinopolymorpha pittospori]
MTIAPTAPAINPCHITRLIIGINLPGPQARNIVAAGCDQTVGTGMRTAQETMSPKRPGLTCTTGSAWFVYSRVLAHPSELGPVRR